MPKDYQLYTKEQLIEELQKTKKMKKYGLVWDEERVKEVFEEEVEKTTPCSNRSQIKADQINQIKSNKYSDRG